MKAPKLTDRRVLRTRRTLRNALVELILERGWDEVSIQDVCERADVGRSTFYMHFADKEDLLLSGFDDLRKELRAQIAAHAGADRQVLGFVRGLLEHVHENQRLGRAMFGKRSGQAVQKHLHQVVLEFVQEDLSGLAPAGPRLEVAVHYVTGAFFELLTWWLDARNPLPPAELSELFHQLTLPVLSTLRGGRAPAGETR